MKNDLFSYKAWSWRWFQKKIYRNKLEISQALRSQYKSPSIREEKNVHKKNKIESKDFS